MADAFHCSSAGYSKTQPVSGLRIAADKNADRNVRTPTASLDPAAMCSWSLAPGVAGTALPSTRRTATLP